MRKAAVAIVFTMLWGVAGSSQVQQGPVSLVQDWSHRHVRYSNTATLQQRVNLMAEPRALHQYLERVWRPQLRMNTTAPGGQVVDPVVQDFSVSELANGSAEFQQGRAALSTRTWDSHRRPLPPVPVKSTNSRVDWAISLGSGGRFPTGETPAKYNFDVTAAPDCDNDFVVFPITANPSATQANLVAVNNLYSGTNPTGYCGTNPTVMWAYRLGTSGTALSPVLSLDGKKVAMLETGTRVILHVVTWQKGQGTSATSPYAGTPNDVTLDYTTVGATGCTNAAAGASNASPYVDYLSDSAFLAADNGILYHVRNVFGGTPTLDYCTLVSANARLTSPVYDSSVNKVFISDGASLFSFDFNPSSGFSNGKNVPVAGAGGITLSPILDGSAQMVYVFSASKAGGSNSIVSQIPYSLAGHTDVNIGAAATGYVLDGVFDNNFYESTDPTTWSLYACGRTAGSATTPALYGISFSSNGTMNTTPFMSANQNINPGGNAGACSPVQEFYNGGIDRLFISTTGSNTVSMFNISSRLTASSTATATAPGYSGGTGNFAVDNTRPEAQASSIYFGTMGSSTTTCPTTGAPTSLSIQAAANSGAASSGTLTVTIPATQVGDLIVVAAGAAASNRSISSVADNASGGSDTFTHASGAKFTATSLFSDIYYALKTTRSGATTVTITYSNNVTNRAAVVWVVRGFNNAVLDAVNGVSNGTLAAGTLTGGSITTTTSAEEFVAGFVNSNGTVTGNPKAGNEFTSGGAITGGAAGASLITASAAAHQPAWTGSGTAFASTTIAFRDNTSTSTANFCAVKLTQSGLK